ncbi:hypothetical protein FRB99_000249 [Tulasnella sp. 403]|nr:hypothetical protein FRB99_000249 [Tulasnella sp. 403]
MRRYFVPAGYVDSGEARQLKFHAPPQFQLYALTVPDFPTSSTEWLLAHSGDTLQCLTVVYLAKLDCLVKQHPGLRSLKILGRMSAASASSAEGFSGLHQLERLEIRDTVFNAAILDTLPPSVRYLRFWSGKVARKVVEMLEEGKLTNVHTIHWDYWSTKEDEKPVHGKLHEICKKRGVELRLCERRDGGRRPGAGPDTSYEEYMRRSCFLHDKTATNSPPSSFVHSEASVTKMPMRVLRDLVEANASLLPHFSAVSPFADNLRGSWPGIWEECFSGHGAWLEDVLPKLKTKRTERAGE